MTYRKSWTSIFKKPHQKQKKNLFVRFSVPCLITKALFTELQSSFPSSFSTL